MPPPWRLSGSGLILASWPDHRDPQLHHFTPHSLRELAIPGVSLTLFVDYRRSEAGPYRELLFIPGRFRIGAAKRWSITRIYVSTAVSARSGRENWGIPKLTADFQLDGNPDEQRSVTVSVEGQPVARLEYEAFGPTLPVSAAVLPAGMRTLAQVADNRIYEFGPTARGRVQCARLIRAESNPALFPDPMAGRRLSVISVPDFDMEFPVARIREGLPA